MGVPAVQMATSPALASGLVFNQLSPLAETRRTAGRIAASDATVLLTGETGTGKEVFARFIHNASPRAARPFVPVNCGAIPDTLLESELFGYVKGAFTGAVAQRRGRVAMAEGGTLFLDEIGELPLGLQVKILRLLQERTYEPVGSSESVSATFRLVAATNRDLAVEVRAGRFRSDLYYRLHVCPMHLPALRERPEDVQPLLAHFWARRGETRPVEPALVRCLEAYAWPGNVRELENLVERLSVCVEGPVIRAADLPPGMLPGAVPEEIVLGLGTESGDMFMPDITPPPLPMTDAWTAPRALSAPAAFAPGPLRFDAPPVATAAPLFEAAPVAMPAERTPIPVMLPVDLPTMLRELENSYIDAALVRTGSNKKEAAKLLGMGRTTLVEKLRRRSADTADTPAPEVDPRQG